MSSSQIRIEGKQMNALQLLFPQQMKISTPMQKLMHKTDWDEFLNQLNKIMEPVNSRRQQGMIVSVSYLCCIVVGVVITVLISIIAGAIILFITLMAIGREMANLSLSSSNETELVGKITHLCLEVGRNHPQLTFRVRSKQFDDTGAGSERYEAQNNEIAINYHDTVATIDIYARDYGSTSTTTPKLSVPSKTTPVPPRAEPMPKKDEPMPKKAEPLNGGPIVTGPVERAVVRRVVSSPPQQKSSLKKSKYAAAPAPPPADESGGDEEMSTRGGGRGKKKGRRGSITEMLEKAGGENLIKSEGSLERKQMRKKILVECYSLTEKALKNDNEVLKGLIKARVFDQAEADKLIAECAAKGTAVKEAAGATVPDKAKLKGSRRRGSISFGGPIQNPGAKRLLIESTQKSLKALKTENAELITVLKETLGAAFSDKMLAEVSAASTDPATLTASPDKIENFTRNCNETDAEFLKDIENGYQNYFLSDPSLPDNPIVYASTGFLTLTGYELNQVSGKNCRFLFGRDTDPEAIHKVLEANGKGSDTSFCSLNYKADGSAFWNLFFISSIRDEDGKILNVVSVQCSVTSDYAETMKANPM